MNQAQIDNLVEVARGDRFVFFRGERSGERVVLRRSTPDAGTNAAGRIVREFELTRRLAIPGTLHPLEVIESTDAGPGILFNDVPKGFLPARSLSAVFQMQPAVFVRFASAAARLLERAHRRRCVFHGLSPDAFWFDPEGGEAIITDLSFATLSDDGPATNIPDGKLLNYISPEQTLRINRAVDYRTDFYSLGATLYELMTGRPPFDGAPLDVIHSHIARSPSPPAGVNPLFAGAVSDIVLKLLAKDPDERYQSAAGLRRDLELCATKLAAVGKVEPFELGARDVSERLNIPRRLYGRENEVERMLEAFDAACEARSGSSSRLLLVSGYSGIGKTALIQELDRPILSRRGYFIAGKFDQVARGVPFGATVQAVRSFVRQLLTESDEELDRWRERLSRALGSGVGVLAEVVPEIEVILGKQPAPDPLGPNETLNRLQLVFQNFFSAAASHERPLVLFLDDLQWADPATLGLLHPLLTGSDAHGFLVIGAYRENEVGSAHPLTRTLATLAASGVELVRLELGPLSVEDVCRFVADTLRLPGPDVAGLARTVCEKTGGNPFFVIQFLRLLVDDALLAFNSEEPRWEFDIDAISGTGVTENIVDLMSRKIRRLSQPASETLSIAASIGSPFDLALLQKVMGQSTEHVAAAVSEAVENGLIMPQRSTTGEDDEGPPDQRRVYSFVHDRIQQAAYELLDENEAAAIHLGVGRMLVAGGQIDEKIFDAVNHLNLGSSLVSEPAEKLELAGLNLAAGRKARSSAAFDSARGYFTSGVGLLPSADLWLDHYELAFPLHLEAAECEYLAGNFDEAERYVDLLLTFAASDVDRAAALRQRMLRFENDGRYPDAIATARLALASFDITLPETDAEKQKELDAELTRIEDALQGRSVLSLVNLPEMNDPRIRMVLEIMTDTWSDVYITGDAALARLISAMMVRLSLEHGNTAASAYGYVTHAITVGPVLGDYPRAGEFGRLALAVNDRFNDRRRRAKINQQFHAHVNLWLEPFAACIPYAREACRAGLEAGDFLYAAYGAMTETWSAILAADDLERFVRDHEPGLSLIRKLKVMTFADAHSLMLGWARSLSGTTSGRGSLSFDDFDEPAYESAYASNTFFTTFLETARMHVGCMFGQYEKARAAADRVHPVIRHLSGTIWPVLYGFWRAMILARTGGDAADLRRAADELRPLAESCPENYLPMNLLLAGEASRIEGNYLDALELYDRTQNFAKKTGNLHFEALAAELTGRLWIERGRMSVAASFLNEAAAVYTRWRAVEKVESMREEFDFLHIERSRADGRPDEGYESLDVQSVAEAARAIASEIELDALARSLVSIAMTNAGADRGVLLVPDDATSELRAIHDHSETSGQPAPVLRSVVNLAHRTNETVIVDNAADDPRFAVDPALDGHRVLAVMCVPIVRQGKPGGVLYLENSVVAGAFTPERVRVCGILAAQASISLENARLYDEMRAEADLRRSAEETLRSVMQGTAAVTGDNFLASLVAHLSAAFKVRYAFVTECREPDRDRARTLAFWQDDRLVDNVEYRVAGTPCLKVLDGETCFYADDIQRHFPEDRDLAALGARGYLGVPLYDSSRKVIGHIAVLDDKPLTQSPQEMSLLAIFAARAGAELERLNAERDLRLAMDEVRQLKDRLEAENVYLQEEIRQQHNFDEIVGDSPALLRVLSQVEQVAATDATVLILGETGTGKELIARAIHHRGPRAASPLVKVNCGAISAGLVESELFGHVKGAFTGAMTSRVGRFELADGGTIFLDEVGELPMETQVKLLRVLQEGEFEAVGSSRTVRTDVRIIAATNRDLEKEVAAGRFRSDLFYRLNVFPVRVPSLRERREDIPLLVMFFLEKFSKKLGKHLTSVPAGVMQKLIEYQWTGNIRELQNVLERAVVLAPVDATSLAPSLIPLAAGELTDIADDTGRSAASDIREVERRHILSVLEETGWVIEGPKGAAQALKLHPNTLRSRLKKLSIQRPSVN